MGGSMPAKKDKKQKRTYLSKEKVIKVIMANRGLIAPAARQLGVQRPVLYRFIKRHPECQEALHDAREAILDVAESQLFDQLHEDDPNVRHKAIRLLLTTVGRSRGYDERKQEEKQEQQPIIISMAGIPRPDDAD